MSVPMTKGGMNKVKIIILVILSGVTTGIGAFFGGIIGSVSENIIAICLSYAAGAMLYIVTGELTPESSKLYNRKNVSHRKHFRISPCNNSSKNIESSYKLKIHEIEIVHNLFRGYIIHTN